MQRLPDHERCFERHLACSAARAAVLLLLAAVTVSHAAAKSPEQLSERPVSFAPHRAVYDIALERAASGSGVVEIAGRMVYELQGSRCEGYTQNMRFVTRMTNQDGSEHVNDLSSSSFEDVATKVLRFNSTQRRDSELVDQTSGDAREAAGSKGISVKLSKPEARVVTVAPAAHFPMRHSEDLIAAARSGSRQFVANLYDGSEKGAKVYATSAMIGKPSVGITADVPPKLRNRDSLAALRSWPVSIAYFDPNVTTKDEVPSYELAFRLFENGVSSKLVIDYGEFAVRGELSDLVYLPASDCKG
ncbi:MAG: cell envelope integrity EipB family protein [Hyphomicrobiaceae bacterium]